MGGEENVIGDFLRPTPHGEVEVQPVEVGIGRFLGGKISNQSPGARQRWSSLWIQQSISDPVFPLLPSVFEVFLGGPSGSSDPLLMRLFSIDCPTLQEPIEKRPVVAAPGMRSPSRRSNRRNRAFSVAPAGFVVVVVARDDRSRCAGAFTANQEPAPRRCRWPSQAGNGCRRLCTPTWPARVDVPGSCTINCAPSWNGCRRELVERVTGRSMRFDLRLMSTRRWHVDTVEVEKRRTKSDPGEETCRGTKG